MCGAMLSLISRVSTKSISKEHSSGSGGAGGDGQSPAGKAVTLPQIRVALRVASEICGRRWRAAGRCQRWRRGRRPPGRWRCRRENHPAAAVVLVCAEAA
eukprot:161861-Prymnesium_polylepis.1